MGAKSYCNEENYNTDFKIWRENLQFEHKNIERSRPPLESTPVGAKTSDAKTPAIDSTHVGVKTSDPKTPATGSSARKGKVQKECIPEGL